MKLKDKVALDAGAENGSSIPSPSSRSSPARAATWAASTSLRYGRAASPLRDLVHSNPLKGDGMSRLR